ncbi:unnamed protein product, partial [Heterosigma akashiwo]
MDWSKLLLLAAIQLLMWCDSVHCENKGGGNYHFFARGGMMPDFQAQDIKVVFQGEPGAYSEKSLRELLGPRVTAIGMQSFEDAFRAVAAREADYALLPVENTLGGSIHANYDLQLKYQLHIVAEHEVPRGALAAGAARHAAAGRAAGAEPPAGPGAVRWVPAPAGRGEGAQVRHGGQREDDQGERVGGRRGHRLGPGGGDLRDGGAGHEHRGRRLQLHALPAAGP